MSSNFGHKEGNAMQQLIFTPAGYERLRREIAACEQQYKITVRDGYESGAAQDGHHDEAYQRSLSAGASLSKRLRDLQELQARARVVVPREQSDDVRLGNGVIAEYEDGTRISFVVDGYLVGNAGPNRYSVHSPLVRAILGASRGDKRVVALPGHARTITIVDIFPPSRANELLQKNEG